MAIESINTKRQHSNFPIDHFFQSSKKQCPTTQVYPSDEKDNDFRFSPNHTQIQPFEPPLLELSQISPNEDIPKLEFPKDITQILPNENIPKLESPKAKDITQISPNEEQTFNHTKFRIHPSRTSNVCEPEDNTKPDSNDNQILVSKNEVSDTLSLENEDIYSFAYDNTINKTYYKQKYIRYSTTPQVINLNHMWLSGSIFDNVLSNIDYMKNITNNFPTYNGIYTPHNDIAIIFEFLSNCGKHMPPHTNIHYTHIKLRNPLKRVEQLRVLTRQHNHRLVLMGITSNIYQMYIDMYYVDILYNICTLICDINTIYNIQLVSTDQYNTIYTHACMGVKSVELNRFISISATIKHHLFIKNILYRYGYHTSRIPFINCTFGPMCNKSDCRRNHDTILSVLVICNKECLNTQNTCFHFDNHKLQFDILTYDTFVQYSIFAQYATDIYISNVFNSIKP